MYADGTLLFVAELRRLIRETKGAVEVNCDVPANDKIAQVLKQVGVFELLGTTCSVEKDSPFFFGWTRFQANVSEQRKCIDRPAGKGLGKFANQHEQERTK
ncbi:hypothetical protein DM43_3861 [Burkholderia cepacia]|uniref:Uncharacterized protein n=2 Tax=Burkholderiaceae TaxID=119060 RepID=A0AA88Z3Y1_BURCE|nr:hypothetical protein DM43_3861 [Burkholderia cepacia]KWE55963.1 hypothetical protein WT53_18855 [Burkholderia sp. MSMB2157WGS]